MLYISYSLQINHPDIGEHPPFLCKDIFATHATQLFLQIFLTTPTNFSSVAILTRFGGALLGWRMEALSLFIKFDASILKGTVIPGCLRLNRRCLDCSIISGLVCIIYRFSFSRRVIADIHHQMRPHKQSK